ncbi:MAG: septal ring lytic transglycosylase RlpA family protein [Pseudomonadota bacterium]
MYRSVVALLWAGVVSMCAAGMASAKIPGKESCYKSICWRVPPMAKLEQAVGKAFKVEASFYDDPENDPFNPPGLTSSGEPFDAGSLSRVASPNLPNGTQMLIWSPATGKAATAIVNNTGPFRRKRNLDVTKALAEYLGFADRGLAQLGVVVLATPDARDIQYEKLRSYAFDGGALGTFASLHDAFRAAVGDADRQLGGAVQFARIEPTSPATDAPAVLSAAQSLDFGYRLRQLKPVKVRPTKLPKPGVTQATSRSVARATPARWAREAFGDR